MNSILLRALRIVIGADSDPVRQVLFANLMQARRSVRLAYRVHAPLAGTWASAVLISGYGLAYYLRISPPAVPDASILAVAKHANARRQVDRVSNWVGQEHCSRILTGIGFGTAIAGALRLARPASLRSLLQSLRIIRVLDRKHGFLVACRSAAAIAWYARTKAMLITHRPGAVLVSSDSNPEEVGFTAAAAALAIQTVTSENVITKTATAAHNTRRPLDEDDHVESARTLRLMIGAL